MNPLILDLQRAITVCDERIALSERNQSKFNEVKKRLDANQAVLDYTRNTANHLNRVYKNIKFFLDNKKSQSKSILEEAIHTVSSIVQDSDLSNCRIEHENGKTRILNDRGQDINAREGSAARATMSFILRYTCLKAMPSKIQIMFLDEALATLSGTTSVNLRELIEVFSDNICIVGIEQRDVLYSGLADKKYIAEKIGKDTSIREMTT